MILGGDEDDRGLEQKDEFEIGRRDIHRTEHEVHLVSAKPAQPLVPRADPHVHRGTRIPVPESLEVSRDDAGGGGPSGRDPELARDHSPVPLGEGVGQAVHPRDHRHRHPVEPATVRREGNAGTVSLEEGDRELVLEPAHELGNGGLAQEGVLRRPGDAPKPRRMTERAKLLQPVAPGVGGSVYRHDVSICLRWLLFLL